MQPLKNQKETTTGQPAPFTKKVNQLTPEQKEIRQLKADLKKEMQLNDSYLAAIHNARLENQQLRNEGIEWLKLIDRLQEIVTDKQKENYRAWNAAYQPVTRITCTVSSN